MQELNIVPEFLARLLEQPGTIALVALLLTAATIDVRSHRIPNWLTGGGIVIGLLFAGAGVAPQQEGLLSSLGGMAAGLAMLLPMYLLRVMGAGDVKLMAMVGAFVGLSHIVPAVLCSVIAGGIAAIAFALYKRAFGRMTTNVMDIVHSFALATMVGVRPTTDLPGRLSIGKLPYGVSIAAGTIAWLCASLLSLA